MRCFTKVLTVSCCLFFASLLGAPTANAADRGRAASSSANASAQEDTAERYGDLPLSFEANQGQTDAQVRFLSRGRGYSFFLTQAGAVLSFSKDAHSDSVLRMQLAGAIPDARIEGLDELPGKSNYFAGSDSSRWRTGVPTYSRVKYENVYPGISLVYYGNQRQLEYDFVVAPGADPRQIRLSVAGAQKLTVDAQGNLVLQNAAGEVQLLAPKVYQQIHGQKQEIAGQWTLAANSVAGFRLGSYDHTQPLVIDPVLMYSSFLGGSQKNVLSKIAIDAAGNAYVAGYTASGDFPAAPTPQVLTFGAGAQSRGAFVAKIDPSGSNLLYSTYLSGSSDEEATGLAVDRSGNVYVAGNTHSTDFPTRNALQSTCATHTSAGTCSSAFLTKISPTGDSLLFSTYLGGNGGESARGLAVDSEGSAYLAGVTSSPDFPATAGAAQAKCGGSCQQNAFVAKFSPSGDELLYATYIGGSAADDAADLAVDSSGSAYLVGHTTSADFPLATPYQKSCAADAASTSKACVATAFVTKIASDGSAFSYSTYLGGSLGSHASAIAVDAKGSAYVTGNTQSSDFPVFKPLQKSCGFDAASKACSVDAFLTKFAPAGKALVYSTYLGGTSRDEASGIALDAADNVHIVGRTESADFPTMKPVQAHLKGTSDAFAARLNSAGNALTFSTYHGGAATESGNGIALDAKGNIYLAGETTSTDFPTHHPFQSSCAGSCTSAFITKMALPPPVVVVTVTPQPASLEVNQVQTFTANVTGGSSGVTWALTGTGCTAAACGTLSNSTTTTVDYTAPASTTNTLSAIVTAKSVDDTTVTDNATFLVTDFALDLTPATASVAPGNGATSTLTASAINGYAATIATSCDVTPVKTNGPACTVAASTAVPGTKIVTLTTAANTPGGSYTATVTGTDSASSPVSHTAAFALDVVTITIAPATKTLEVNNTQLFTATITPVKPITWALSGTNCAGATCGTLSSASGATTTYTAPATAPLGTVTLTASASGGFTGTATITVTDFALSVNPATKDVLAGNNVTTTLTAAAFNANGYAGTLTPSCSVLAGVTCAFAPNPFTGPGTSTVTVSTTVAAATGQHAITITATDGAAVPDSNTTTLTLNVVTIAVNPAAPTVEVNNTQSFTGVVTGLIDTTVNWSLSGTNCAGATCGTLSSATGSPVTYTAPATAPLGTVTLTATASDGLTRTATITVTDYKLTATPTSATSVDVAPTGTANAAATLTASAFNANSYAGTVGTLSCVTPPAGVTCTFNPTSLTVPGTPSSSVSISTSNVPAATYTLTLQGIDGATVPQTRTTTLALHVVQVTISTAPPSTIEVGQSVAFAGAAAGLGGAVNVNWSIVGTNCTSSACGSFDQPGPNTSTNYLSPATTVNGLSVAIKATSNGDPNFSDITSSIPITDYTISLAGGPQVIGQTSAGATGTSTLSAAAVNGYAGTITAAPCAISPASSTLGSVPTCAVAPPAVPGSKIVSILTQSDTPTGTYNMTVTTTDAASVMHTTAIQRVAVNCGFSLGSATSFLPVYTPRASQGVNDTFSFGVAETAGGSNCAWGDKPIINGTIAAAGFTGAVTSLDTTGDVLTAVAGFSKLTITTVDIPESGSVNGTVSVPFFDPSGLNSPLVMHVGVEAGVPISVVKGGVITPFALPVTLTQAAGNSVIVPNANLPVATVCGAVDNTGTPDLINNFGITCTATATSSSIQLTVTLPADSAAARPSDRGTPAILAAVAMGFPAIVFLSVGASAFSPKQRKHGFRRLTCILGILLLLSLLVVLPACGGGFKANFITPNSASYTLTVMAYVQDSNNNNIIGIDIFTVPLTVH